LRSAFKDSYNNCNDPRERKKTLVAHMMTTGDPQHWPEDANRQAFDREFSA
jgi:hypothetical protein